MVVDDAVVVRGLVSRWIEEEPGLEIVASLRTGREAVDQLERANPDVVILDVEMPDIDGLTALPLLLEKKRDLVVIMASTLTRRNAEVSLKALSLGAADYIPKPETNRERHDLGDVPPRPDRQDPPASARAAGASRRACRRAAVPSRAPRRRGRRARSAARASAEPLPRPRRSRRSSCGRSRHVTPRVLLIGSSTGGPQALTAVVRAASRR